MGLHTANRQPRRIGVLILAWAFAVPLACPPRATPSNRPADAPQTAPATTTSIAGQPTAATPDELFLAAAHREDWPDALAIADAQLAVHPTNGVWLTYRGMCLELLGQTEAAVDSFLRGELAGPVGFRDKQAVYLRARALYQMKMYGRAQQELDHLQEEFSRSRLAERGQELAVVIERELAGGISVSNANWYLQQGVNSHVSARPAIAIEFLEEYLLLISRLDPSVAPHPRALLSLGAAYLELAAPRQALDHLDQLPITESEYRAGLFRALALFSMGDDDTARGILREIVASTTSEAVRERARRLLER